MFGVSLPQYHKPEMKLEEGSHTVAAGEVDFIVGGVEVVCTKQKERHCQSL